MCVCVCVCVYVCVNHVEKELDFMTAKMLVKGTWAQTYQHLVPSKKGYIQTHLLSKLNASAGAHLYSFDDLSSLAYHRPGGCRGNANPNLGENGQEDTRRYGNKRRVTACAQVK